ncbi:MAG: DUF445 domain-containing protein [Aliivibrio sp.]|uniref:DUF445 domain-containing protein n=1 Tax=Aliivibrio sp. TaxID=1872443 RepID=UPI001A46E097|nr:DUF445 domain-containing protein [Aliivibrio sp.]
MFNKSVITNVISLIILFIGYQIDQPVVIFCGLFAFSGALTNWLAIHMLFEKVPGLYGSGVIPSRFEEFKRSIQSLMMEQFFTQENVDRFLQKEMSGSVNIDLNPVIQQIDLSPTFDSLVEVISNSSFGSMLAMVGGAEALQPLREPFIEKMKSSIVDISQQDNFKHALKNQFEKPELFHEMKRSIEDIIEQRLNELTPQIVKEMVQKIIKEHLGWLVVWGGVFGGLIGIISAYMSIL